MMPNFSRMFFGRGCTQIPLAKFTKITLSTRKTTTGQKW